MTSKAEHNRLYRMRHPDKVSEERKRYLSRHPLFSVHNSMMVRCGHRGTPKGHNAKNYYYRGIRVCDEWHHFPNFELWAVNHGYKKGLQIDRIDNNGNYCPENCRFVTAGENQNNRSVCIFVNFNGNRLSLKKAWRESKCPVSYESLKNRIKNGMEFSVAISKPHTDRWGHLWTTVGSYISIEERKRRESVRVKSWKEKRKQRIYK